MTQAKGPGRDQPSVIDQQIVDGYTRTPQGGEHDVDEWGNLGAWVTGLTAEQAEHMRRQQGTAADPP